ncbi:MAG: PKD domain-containing protein [Armatimonadia bacterium]
MRVQSWGLGFLYALLVASLPGSAVAALTVAIVQPAGPPQLAVNAAVTFRAAASEDGEQLDAAKLQWEWQFGDAVQGDGNPARHAYIAAGTYKVMVTARLGKVTAAAAAEVVVGAGEQTPKAFPFDPALSVYVGFSGMWVNYRTGGSEFREIEGPVAGFLPGEKVSDAPDIWGRRQINDPQSPTGWTFFAPDPDETMQMHVIVRDTQKRLGDVLITNRETGAELGTIAADVAGEQVDGLIDLPNDFYFLLTIREKPAKPEVRP